MTLKKEVQYRNLWRTGFGRNYGLQNERQCFSLQGRVTGVEADHSPHSCVDAKNEWLNKYNPPIRFHGVERDLTLHAS